jgi:hypothetical protein
VSIALVTDQKKPFVGCISMGHTLYAGATNFLWKIRVLAVSSPCVREVRSEIGYMSCTLYLLYPL